MKADSSKLAHKKFETLLNKNVCFYLIDGTIYKGQLMGFFKGLEKEGEPYILQWHIIGKEYFLRNSLNSQEIFGGKLIQHSQIKWIEFDEDQSIIEFNA